MRNVFMILALVLLTNCEDEPENPSVDYNFAVKVNTTFEGQPMERFVYYDNVMGDKMSFEQVRIYLAEMSLIKSNGDEVPVTEIEFFNLEGTAETRNFNVAPGTYSGIRYHIGVPTPLNGTDDPDFLTNQYGPGNPLNVQNGMYWSWNTGYRFAIYEGRLDTTPDISNDFPAFFSIHLGKDTLYTTVDVNQSFTIEENCTTTFAVNWDLGKSFYNATDTLDLRSPLESQFHGEDLNLGFRFQACMKDALSHSVQ